MKKKKTPSQLIKWLEGLQGCALISDDNGHWAVSGTGFQSVAVGDEPVDVSTEFIVFKDEWKNTIREAIEHAMEDWEN